jgi:RNA polymerase sigma factor (TIGR02999 family)
MTSYHLTRHLYEKSSSAQPKIPGSGIMLKMNTASSNEVTELLQAWGTGDKQALDKLFPIVYKELHRLAAAYMRKESPGHTLQTSALVNEAYLKLVDQKNVRWQNRAHFFGIAAQLMRRILVDHARSRTRMKRGAGAQRLSLNEAAIISADSAEAFLSMDDALKRLGEMDPKKCRIVEMKIFCGLNMKEIAEVEKVSPSTIEREWRKAKAWLHREIQQ